HEVNAAIEVSTLGGCIEAELAHAEPSRDRIATSGGFKNVQVWRLWRPQLRSGHSDGLQYHLALARTEREVLRRRRSDDRGLFPAMHLLVQGKRNRITPGIAHSRLHRDGAVCNLRRDLNTLNHRTVTECERNTVIDARSPTNLLEIGSA